MSLPLPQGILRRILLLLVFAPLFVGPSARAQALDETFNNIFDYFLNQNTGKIQLGTQGIHGTHFQNSADQANEVLVPALNSLIVGNISSFPFSSTVAGVTFDFSSGVPVAIRESLGPIFAESASTLGSGRLNVGFTFSYLNMRSFRDVATDEINFAFAHQDNPPPNDPNYQGGSLGNPPLESDFINLNLGLDVNATIGVLTFTAGITNRLDIGMAVPVVNVNMEGTARAEVISYSYGRLLPNSPQSEGAAHRFGGTALDPELIADTTYEASTSGLGDLAVRLKYNFVSDMAALLDVRLPTGSRKNFLGTGETGVRFAWIMSHRFGDFTPHLNLAYDYRPNNLDSDEAEFAIGFDHKVSDQITFAVDVLGAIDLDDSETIDLDTHDGGTVLFSEPFTNSDGTTGIVERTLRLNNVPGRTVDNTFDTAIGFRFAPSDKVVLLGNILVPMNDSGLRSSVIPSIGFSVVI